ncbi:TetR/AcrR family transcriptional regulator [Rhodococcoides kyotonense]|uniref:DNA-binding transcriptional regulator, AcrR family n=1 Tax=Rhodococcoides kyotonense TaxID=398843 RepID=A0A239KIA5_9NOCA|nr:TetR/AcrR family transcriptional regulator [Rhodococcus kyotonensis]SNT17353.1 DNA-binding transcriptional regulator, AcrR family [Rhodococcus kyotonensis]
MVRTRLSRSERYDQLIDVSWSLVREEGADALTLGRLAERAGVAKPVVYSHFASRAALLADLYKEFDDRQGVTLERYVSEADPTLEGRAAAIANSYVGCTLAQGRELTGVLAALEGSPELEQVKRSAEDAYSARCRELLEPFAGAMGVTPSSLTAIFGAAEALSRAAASDTLSPDHARTELSALIVAMVGRA